MRVNLRLQNDISEQEVSFCNHKSLSFTPQSEFLALFEVVFR